MLITKSSKASNKKGLRVSKQAPKVKPSVLRAPLNQISLESSSFRHSPNCTQTGTTCNTNLALKALTGRLIHRMSVFLYGGCGIGKRAELPSAGVNALMPAVCRFESCPPYQSTFNKRRARHRADVTKQCIEKAESSREAFQDEMAPALTPPDALLMGYGITEYLCTQESVLNHTTRMIKRLLEPWLGGESLKHIQVKQISYRAHNLPLGLVGKASGEI